MTAARTTRRLARASLIAAVVVYLFGATVYVVTLTPLLAALTPTVASALGQIGLLFAAASLGGGLFLARHLAVWPLAPTLAALFAASALMMLVFLLAGGFTSLVAIYLLQLPFGVFCGLVGSLFPAYFTDAYPADHKRAAGVLASAGGVAAVLGGITTSMLLSTAGTAGALVVVALSPLPLAAVIHFVPLAATSMRTPATSTRRSIWAPLASARTRNWLLVGALLALTLRPLRNLVAPLSCAICDIPTMLNGRFIAALAVGMALTRVAQRCLGERARRVCWLFMGATLVLGMLAAAAHLTPTPVLHWAVLAALVAGGLVFGLCESRVLAGVQEHSHGGERIGAIALLVTATTVVAGVSSWVWGTLFDLIGVDATMVVVATVAVVSTGFLAVRRAQRRPLPGATATAT